MKRRVLLAILLVVAGIFLLIQQVAFGRILNVCASCISYPYLVAHRYTVMPIISWWQRSSDIKELHKQLAQQQHQYQELLATHIADQAARTYADDIAELIRFKNRYKTDKKMVTQVLMHNSSDHGHYILVDKGSRSHVQPDMVAVFKNCLIGKVTEVYPWYAKVTLISDPSCKVASYCTKTKAHGIHEGICNAQKSHLCHVSHLDKLQRDDFVLSSGKGLVFPQGFVLGKIGRYEQKGLFYDVEVNPVVDVSKLEYCMLLQKE